MVSPQRQSSHYVGKQRDGTSTPLHYTFNKPVMSDTDFYFDHFSSNRLLTAHDFLKKNAKKNEKDVQTSNRYFFVNVVILEPNGFMSYHHINPNDPFDIAALNKDWNAALQAVEDALVENPDSIYHLHRKSLALAELDRNHESISCCKDILSLAPQNIAALQDLAFRYHDIGDIASAESTLLKAYQVDPNNFATMRDLGSFYQGQGQLDKALGFYQKAHEKEPHRIEALTDLARYYETTGDFDKAIHFNKKVLSHTPCDAYESVWLHNFKRETGRENHNDIKTHFESLNKPADLLQKETFSMV